MEWLRYASSMHQFTEVPVQMEQEEDSFTAKMRHKYREEEDFSGSFDDYMGYLAKKRWIFEELKKWPSVKTFDVSPTTTPKGFSVTPASPSSGYTQSRFQVKPVEVSKFDLSQFQPKPVPVPEPVANAVDLTFDSDEEEEEVVKLTTSSASMKKISASAMAIMERVAQSRASLKTTPLYDSLTRGKDSAVKAWINEERRAELRAQGYFVPPSPVLPPLSPDARNVIRDVWSSTDPSLTFEAGDIPLSVRDLRRMQGKTWLNDECINGYLQLIQARSAGKIHCFNTFFYASLSTKGYGSVQRWSRRFDLFSKELILVPVHLGMHWTMSCIDLVEKRIIYLDSFHAGNQACLDHLWDYLDQEHQDKKGRPWNPAGWSATCQRNGVPQQQNGYDCGVFTCVFAEHLARRAPFEFSQADMQYFRHRITYELVTAQLLE